MAAPKTQRKLTAILCTDVVRYSRLMGEDEAATLRSLTEYRRFFAAYIENFWGRIVNPRRFHLGRVWRCGGCR